MIDTNPDASARPDGGRTPNTSTDAADAVGSVDFGRPDTVGIGADWTLVEQCNYDPAGETSLTVRLVETIAAALGCVDPVRSMDPLYHAVDVEAIERTLFGPPDSRRRRESRRRDSTVTFEYEGRQVTAREDGWIFVYAPNHA